jgi:hypothetical protein
VALVNPNYSFNTIQAKRIIDESFSLCGINREKIDSRLINSALFSINSIITSWMNEGVIQFTETQTLIKLQNNLIRYKLPRQFYDVYDFNLATLGRRRIGTPYSSNGGNASAAFDENLTTACTQTAPNGTIGINFTPDITGNPVRVDFFGILSNIDTPYQLVLEGSNDNINWINLFTMRRPTNFIGFPSELSVLWFQVNQPEIFQYLQIHEIGGNTLNIRELYFEEYINSLYRKNVGRSTYMQMSARDNQSTPTLYSLEKQEEGVVFNVYQAPSDLPLIQDYTSQAGYNNFALMRAVEYPLDINFLSDELPINRLFIPAMQYALATQLCGKVGRIELLEPLSSMASMEFQKAKLSNNDLGGMSIQKSSYTS